MVMRRRVTVYITEAEWLEMRRRGFPFALADLYVINRAYTLQPLSTVIIKTEREKERKREREREREKEEEKEKEKEKRERERARGERKRGREEREEEERERKREREETDRQREKRAGARIPKVWRLYPDYD